MNQGIDIDLLQYEPALRRSTKDGVELIFDPVRKKNIHLGPEEFVRQLFLQFLLDDDISAVSRIAVEKQFKLNGRIKRFDILIYNKLMKPHTLIECKSPSHKLGQKDLDQMVNYNMAMEAPRLILTNGRETLAWNISLDTHKVTKLDQLNLIELYN